MTSSWDTEGGGALELAFLLQEAAARKGFDWPDWRGAAEKCLEEMEEVRRAIAEGDASAVEGELGDLLFAVVNWTRLLGVGPTGALAAANRRFQERFGALERLAEERGLEMTEAGLDRLDELWEEVKRRRGGR